MTPRRILFASPPEPSGASWLVNCFLELGIKVRYKPVVDRVWRNTRPRPPPEYMWRASDGLFTLHPKAEVLQKWLPALTRVQHFAFRDDVVVEYVQDLARVEHGEHRAVFFVRDPRDAIYSMYRRMQPELSFAEFLELRDPHTLLDRVDQWNLRVSAWSSLPNVRVFRFEDYKLDADAVLRAVMEWLQLDAEPAALARAVAESTYEKARAAEAEYRRNHPADTEVANRAGRVNDWQNAQLEGFAARVEEQAGAALQQLGYATGQTGPRDVGAGFRGAAPLRSLASLRAVLVPDTLAAQAADPAAFARSVGDLAAFIERVDAGFLQNSRLAADEIRALLDSLAELAGVCGLDVGQRLDALRPMFEDGSAYHFERLKHLLARVRAGRAAAKRADAGAGSSVLRPATDGRPALFSPEALLAAARATTGGGDFDVVDRPALDALCAGFEHAPMRLNFFGKKRAEAAVVDALVKRVRLQRYLSEHPGLGAIAIPRPMFIVAPYRTGTTFLHQLLACDPDHRSPRIWEALHPPPATAALRGDPRYLEADPRVAQTAQFLASFHRRHPGLGQLHPVDPRAAEECYGLLETSLLSHSFLFHGAVNRYLAYLDERSDSDWCDAYRVYADQLRLLQWWSPGQRWVLKSPVHLWNLGALLEVFPDALVVQIHRDPLAAMRSFCTLLKASYAAIAADPDDHLIGSIARGFTRGAAARCAQARRVLPTARFLDVAFDRLIARPVDVVVGIYAACGATLRPEVEARMRAWLPGAATGSAAGSGPASLREFGLEDVDIDRDCAPYSAFAPAPRCPE